MHKCYVVRPEALTGSHGGGKHLPAFSPQVPPSGSQPQWGNMTTSVELTTLTASRQTQPKAQHMVATFTSGVIWAAIKNLTTLDIDGYHQQMWCSFHLKAIIISFFFREVGNVLYGKPGGFELLGGYTQGPLNPWMWWPSPYRWPWRPCPAQHS